MPGGDLLDHLRLLQVQALRHPETSHAAAPQLRHVAQRAQRPAEVVAQRPHVEAAAAGHAQREEGRPRGAVAIGSEALARSSAVPSRGPPPSGVASKSVEVRPGMCVKAVRGAGPSKLEDSRSELTMRTTFSACRPLIWPPH